MYMHELINRYKGNPILRPENLPNASAVLNSAFTEHDGRTIGILRVEQLSGLQSMRLAESDDGINFKVHDEHILVAETEPLKTYLEACYDPRITKIDDTYYITYAAENRFGCQIGLAKTQDFKKFEIIDVIAEPDNRNIVLFPKKIKGLYWRLDRPFSGNQGGIWVSTSPDLIHWGRHRCIMESRRFHWDRGKIGPAAPPVETPEGWLVLYHGTTPLCNGLVYRVGVALLDLEDPTKVIARPKGFLMSPSEPYEQIGIVPNVCFPCAALPKPDGTLWIYYGAADTVLCLAFAKIKDLIDWCLHGD